MTAILVLSVLGGWFFWINRQQPVETEEEGIAWYQNDSLLWAQLAESIEDAKQLDSTKISNQLMPIKKDYPGQEWANFDGKDMVLMVTLVDSSRLARFFGRDDVYQIDRELGTWASLPLDWKNRAAEYEGLDSVAAHMRMVQMYGLSPDCDYNIMVQFYADPAGIFRPSHDPDITTTSTSLEFPTWCLDVKPLGIDRRGDPPCSCKSRLNGLSHLVQSNDEDDLLRSPCDGGHPISVPVDVHDNTILGDGIGTGQINVCRESPEIHGLRFLWILCQVTVEHFQCATLPEDIRNAKVSDSH